MQNFNLLIFKIALCTIVFIGATACTTTRKDFVFSLEGKLKNIYPGHIILYKATGLHTEPYDIVDTLLVKADSTFSASYNLEPHFYILSIYDSLYVKFIADVGQRINISFPSKDTYKLSGSPDTKLFEEYEEFRTGILEKTVYPVRRKLYQLLRRNNPKDAISIKKLGQQVFLAEAHYRDTLINFVRKMGTSIAIYPTMVRWNGDKHIDYYEKLATDFVRKHKGLEVARLVSEKIRILKQVSIGGKVSGIIAKDTSETKVSLYKSLGKYTLIDFWGSWCAPCRAESRHLTNLYKQYKHLGFTIFGVAIKTRRKAWIKAIKKDHRTWINVSAPNGYASTIAKEYSVTALPKNFLVDKDGVIIAKDIHGTELDEKITSLFSDKKLP